MKIDIDLSEMFDEEGNNITPSFQESIMTSVTNIIVSRISKSLEQKLADELNNRVEELVSKMLDDMIPQILDYEFQETRGYGYEPAPKITVRNKIFKDIEKAMVWKDGSFDSDKSPYTKSIKKAVEEKLSAFSKEFNKTVDEKFITDAMEYAANRIKARAGIKS